MCKVTSLATRGHEPPRSYVYDLIRICAIDTYDASERASIVHRQTLELPAHHVPSVRVIALTLRLVLSSQHLCFYVSRVIRCAAIHRKTHVLKRDPFLSFWFTFFRAFQFHYYGRGDEGITTYYDVLPITEVLMRAFSIFSFDLSI